jgi:two-component system, OmpR family, sensor histidine kinase MprB
VSRGPLMLRTRFTFAVAAAVAAVTLVITAVAFLVVRADLQNQLREELREQSAVVHRLARHYHGHIPVGWVPPHSDRFGAASPYTQLVTARGAIWASSGDAGLLPADAASVQVAAGQRAAYYRMGKVAGVQAMIYTAPLAPGLAVQLAVPCNTVDLEVASVGATLALLSAIGVAAAALVGWGVARAGLAPVGRLAAVAEQVTATGDPGRRVEVDRADELGRLAMSFNTMLGALQRSLAAQRQLVSDASHELRTPLTSMRINVELLAAQPGLPEAQRQEILARVVAQVAELGDLVAGVTELASDEPPASTAAEVRLDEVAAAGLEAARRDWPRTVFLADLEPCVVSGDAARIQIAIRNLLDNAAKFGAPGAPVEVSLHAAELTVRDGAPVHAAELTVRDHGPGIAPEDLPHVFDRFYRAPSARAVPGSGLGLAIVRQVAERHGGTVQARPAPGGGTLLRLMLPRSGDPHVADDGATPGRLREHAVLTQDPGHLRGDPDAARGRGMQPVTRTRERPPPGERIHDDHAAVGGDPARHDRVVGPVGGGRA